MPEKLPSIIVTGASGIVGRNFLEAAKRDFLIYAIARRSQREAGVAVHPNIRWIQVDIGNWLSLSWVMHNIEQQGGADYILHLAAYYDFEYVDHPEYERTNIKGTRYVLEQAKILRVKRFIFASSIAASNFPAPGEEINEKTPVDAAYAYAASKRKGEEMVREFSKWFPCSVVRFAAVFTDWGEYGVLYVFLSTWLSKKWNARMLGGKGESAVPYIHARDLCKLLLTIFRKSEKLPRLDTYIASPEGSTSHRELFEIATRLYWGKSIKPVFMPKFLALPGTIVRDIFGRLLGRRPFERPWMLKYLDYKLDTNASYTRKSLSWEPTPRYHILRRLLFLIEKMKSDPLQWHGKNAVALKRIFLRPNLLIYELLIKLEDENIGEIKDALLDTGRRSEFPNYQKMDKSDLDWYVHILYQLLGSAVRNNDRMLLADYIEDLANMRFKSGFKCEEVCGALVCIGEIIGTKLAREPDLKGLGQEIHDHISLTLQMAVDEVEDAFENLSQQESLSRKMEMGDIENKINTMETFYKSPGAEEEHLLE
jgi:nucleoside-diphosphate-sugar epimerase